MKKSIKDPFAKREAEKYENPIPSREFIIDYLRERGRPATRGVLIKALRLEDPDQQEGLRRRLRAMERDGQLVFTRRGGYGLVEKMDLISGCILGHKDGFGFLIPDDGSGDLFLNARQMRSVFNGDRVLARVTFTSRKGKREGEIVEILERKTSQLVGRFFEEHGICFVTPDNKRITQDIIIPPEQRNSAENGQFVSVEITSPPTMRKQAVGRIVEVIGEHMQPGMEIDVAIRSHAIPNTWSEELLAQITDFPKIVSKDEIIGRVDLRNKPFVTIDGEDAKDFDDTVYAEKRKGGGWTLYVAIADVSHYVKPNTALDEEALERGNSVYFPGRVVPMLPEILSNELCSLKPKVDRLCLVCEMSISTQGRLTRYRFHEGVIHSHARMTYTNVAKILVNQDKKLRKQYTALVSHLDELYELYKILHQNRQYRGALEFDTTETKIKFGKGRKIQEIIPVERNDAHRLIEECMLLANVSAAKFLLEHQLPGLYRVHEGPTEEKLEDLRKFLSELGLRLPGGKKPKPKYYADLLLSIAERPDAHLIQTILLRSLSQAVYSPDSIGHFGLAYDHYTHYTSPIRRYPDLLVHRAIRHQIQHKPIDQFHYDHNSMVKWGEHCSFTERRADDATRDVIDWLKCEYIMDRIGEEFDGLITSVTAFGLFVELKNIYVEGLVHVTALKNDYYHFDNITRCLTGERTGKRYRLADPIRVKVVRVDLDDRQIDFELAETKK